MNRTTRKAAPPSPPEISETGELMIRALDSMASFDVQLEQSRQVVADVKRELAKRRHRPAK